MALSAEAIATLKAVSTATLTTVLLKKGLRNVWIRGAVPLKPGQPRIVGPAFTPVSYTHLTLPTNREV